MGQHPIFATDTQAILEKIGFFLDEEHEDSTASCARGTWTGGDLTRRISEDLDVTRVLTRPRRSGTAATRSRPDRQRRRLRRARSLRHPAVPLFPERRGRGLRLRARAALTVFDLAVEEVREVEPGTWW
jgi:amidophosphoribosyltransferase